MRPVKETKQFKSPYPSLIKPYRCGRTVLRSKLAFLHETRRTAYLTVVLVSYLYLYSNLSIQQISGGTNYRSMRGIRS